MASWWGRRYVALLLLVGLVMPVTTTVSYGKTSGAQSSLTIAHTSDAQPLYVLLSWWVNGGATDPTDRVLSVTFDGVALTRGGHGPVSGNTMQWWRLFAPAATTANVVITLSSSRKVSAAVLNLSDWPADIADHVFASAGGRVDLVQPTVTIASEVASEVIDWVAFNDEPQTSVAGGGQSELWSQDASTGTLDQRQAGSLKAGAASVTMSWTLAVTSGHDYWGLGALSFPAEAAADGACYGGGEVEIVPDEPDGETFTGRTIGIRAWATFAFDDQDRSFSLDRYNHLPSYHGGPKLGHLIRFGGIRRQLSDRFSSYKQADVNFEFDDTSRILTTLEDTTASQHWQYREVRAFGASPETIAASGTAHSFGRWIWTGYQSRGLTASLQASDTLGSHFSDLNLEQTIPSELIGESFTGASEEMQGRVVPIAMGKWLDAIQMSGDPVQNVAAVAVASAIAAPSGFTATATTNGSGVGDEGITEYYALSAVVGGVESAFAYANMTLGSGDNACDLAWSSYPAASSFRLYSAVRSDFLQFAEMIAEIPSGSTSYTDLVVLINQNHEVLADQDTWQLGLRMNVIVRVWAKLADGGYSMPGTATVTFTPVRMANRDRTATYTWDAYPGAVGYVVVRQRTFYTNWTNAAGGFDARWDVGPSVLSITDAMTSAEDAVEVPSVPSGTLPLLDVGYTTTINGTRVRGLLLCKGAIQHVEQIYKSRALIGAGSYTPTDEDTFDMVPEDAYGVSWWAPGKPNWSDASAEQYVEVNGNWYTLIFTSEEPLPVHIRCNACTRTDVSDGTGSVITGACRAIFHLLNQEILPPPEDVWTSGDYLDPREFDDGVPVVNSATVAQAEAIEAARMVDASTATEPREDGYQIQAYFDEPITIRTFLEWCAASFDLRFGQNEHGQFIFAHLNEFVDLDGCASVTDIREIQAGTMIDRRVSELENKVLYDWGYRPADQSYDFPSLTIQDDIAIAANRGRAVSGDRLEFRLTRDAPTVESVAGWRLAFGKYPPRYVRIVGPLHWLSIKLGDVIKATDAEGIGATGWTDRPLWVVGIDLDLKSLSEDDAPEVALTCIDVQRFLSSFGAWAPAGNDWATSSDDDQAEYSFWSNASGEMPDGSDGKDWS